MLIVLRSVFSLLLLCVLCVLLLPPARGKSTNRRSGPADDLRASIDQRLGTGPADATTSTGHDRHAAIQHSFDEAYCHNTLAAKGFWPGCPRDASRSLVATHRRSRYLRNLPVRPGRR